MLRFDFIVGGINSLMSMLLTAFVRWGAFEIIKSIFKISESVKKAYPYGIMVISFVVYAIIAGCKGWISPILTGLMNGVVLGFLEGGMFSMLSGLKKLLVYLWSKIRR